MKNRQTFACYFFLWTQRGLKTARLAQRKSFVERLRDSILMFPFLSKQQLSSYCRSAALSALLLQLTVFMNHCHTTDINFLKKLIELLNDKKTFI